MCTFAGRIHWIHQMKMIQCPYNFNGKYKYIVSIIKTSSSSGHKHHIPSIDDGSIIPSLKSCRQHCQTELLTSILCFFVFWFITQHRSIPYKMPFKVHQPSANQLITLLAHIALHMCVSSAMIMRSWSTRTHSEPLVVAYLYASRESSECTDNIYYIIIILYTEWYKF